MDVRQKTIAKNMMTFELMRCARRHAHGHKHLSCRQRVESVVDYLLCGMGHNIGGLSIFLRGEVKCMLWGGGNVPLKKLEFESLRNAIFCHLVILN